MRRFVDNQEHTLTLSDYLHHDVVIEHEVEAEQT